MEKTLDRVFFGIPANPIINARNRPMFINIKLLENQILGNDYAKYMENGLKKRCFLVKRRKS
jgi:hypothetical protein